MRRNYRPCIHIYALQGGIKAGLLTHIRFLRLAPCLLSFPMTDFRQRRQSLRIHTATGIVRDFHPLPFSPIMPWAVAFTPKPLYGITDTLCEILNCRIGIAETRIPYGHCLPYRKFSSYNMRKEICGAIIVSDFIYIWLRLIVPQFTADVNALGSRTPYGLNRLIS